MAHEGTCYRNSNLNPASAEEPLAVEAARDLLVDESGKPRGDDRSIMAIKINGDSDTRATTAFIAEQNRIIGEAADGLAEHVPDGGHIRKNQNNDFYKLRVKDPSFTGNHGLTNNQITSITSDTKHVVDFYTEQGVGNADARNACLEQLDAIIPHKCGQHDKCKQEKFCTHLKVKNQHPDWTNEQIEEEVARTTRRPKHMSLSAKGIEKCTAIVSKRYNAKTIDKAANGGCSNLSEHFFGLTGKFTDGKRKNQDHTDSWQVANKLVFCRIGDGNVQHTQEQVSASLGLPVSSAQVNFLRSASKKVIQVRKRQTADKFKESRCIAKMTRDKMMGKVSKRRRHRSEKKPLSESAKSRVGKKPARNPSKCSTCVQLGHNCKKCQLPQMRKRKAVDLAYWDLDRLRAADRYGIKAPKRRKELDLVPMDEWI